METLRRISDEQQEFKMHDNKVELMYMTLNNIL